MGRENDVEDSDSATPLEITEDIEEALADVPNLQRRNELRCGIEKMLDHYNSAGKFRKGNEWLSKQAEEIRTESDRLRWEQRIKHYTVIAGTFIGSTASTYFGQQ